ncbi:endospore germination permease [Lysinibacillus sp. BPa_S21]|uniref:GerAB/ArcD/ProY family transporter n=1 Tax=Lysinibacillus sp. BPa_S21 TaxID=2932478 RepID=UPI002010EEF8|nr:endospore germination permease [Lysinibacillus sp. BPa_S21]MCL1697023.1 endospore germination permease [Lysinibacillus sp. BPa_S21]
MMEKEIISSRQFMIITLLFSIGTAILIIPSTVTSESKQDAWIVAIIGVAISLLLVKLFVALGNRTPTQTFIEANETILGRFFGKITALGFISLTLLSAGELLFFIGAFMKTEVMVETPTMVFALLFGIIIVYATYLGIEVFARSTEILFPIFILIFIVFVICISPQIHIENIKPILEASPKSISFSMFQFISLFSFPLAVLLMIFPSAVNVHKSAQKGFYIGSMIGGLILIIIIILCILVLGPANTAARISPSYALAQRISIGNFVQRIEVIMAVMWIISIFIRTFMYFYASVIGIAQVCKIKDHRPLIFPIGLITIGLSQIIHPNIVHSYTYNREIWPLFSGVFTVSLPLLLLIVAMIRKINGNQGNTTQSNTSSNGGNSSQSESNSNDENSTQSNNSNNSAQSDSGNNSNNSSQSNSSSNNENSAQGDSSSNSNNSSQSDSSSNNENSAQGDSSSDNSNQSDSSSDSNNSTQNESDTGNTPNSDRSGNSSDK